MTRLVLHESARWARAIGAPLAVFALITFVPSLLPAEGNGVARSAGGELLSVVWVAACGTSLAWLAAKSVRAALQPARDRRAAERLQELRDRAAGHDTRLLCVERSLWQSQAGQRLVASDVQIGTVIGVWLAESAVPSGAFALVTTARQSTLVDWISPGDISAARRAERLEAVRYRARVARVASLAARRERKAAAEVVRAAEGLLR